MFAKVYSPSSLAIGLLSAGILAISAPGSEGPDPREIPVPQLTTAAPPLPGVGQLPVRTELPAVLIMQDGTPVTTSAQWEKRRDEMKQILSYYAVGEMPPPPGNVSGSESQRETVLEGKATYRLVHLSFGPERKLGFDIGIYTPAGRGPFPAIILQSGSPPGATPLPRLAPGPTQGRGQDVLLVVGGKPEIIAPRDSGAPAADTAAGPDRPTHGPAVARGGPAAAPNTPDAMGRRYMNIFERGYALVIFNPNDCAEDTTLRNPDGSWAFRSTRFFPAYPGYDWGILAAWAWGASRVADYLASDGSIDARRLIITGASRNGKSSLIAAAFDDRLMGAPVVTGGGGIGAYRSAGPRNSETLDVMMKKYPNWFSPHLHEFWGQREKLPFDEHWFLALCAPRPFIALEGDADVISYGGAVKQSFLAAAPAYALTGAPDRLGVNYAPHAHAFTNDDWTALMDFADKYLRGKKVERTFDHFPSEAELDVALARPGSRSGHP